MRGAVGIVVNKNILGLEIAVNISLRRFVHTADRGKKLALNLQPVLGVLLKIFGRNRVETHGGIGIAWLSRDLMRDGNRDGSVSSLDFRRSTFDGSNKIFYRFVSLVFRQSGADVVLYSETAFVPF